ncbi:MAG: site-specific DNA-methyltransferase [Acidobacteriaceae bacterium]|nr:site-specific DNA-methyltransferase [Acidobacteriaceae bacterium]
MNSKNKLELTWIGKENRPKLEPRILLEDTEKSYHARQRVTSNDIFDNRLIFGDNLLALKTLEQEFSGKVKCVFIDPPYNTGSAFTHYDDGIEHSIWLSLMRDRLELIRRLLANDGSLWITIDDNEAHYLKVLCDEVFGRQNFVTTVIWQKNFAPKSSARHFSVSHDHLLVIARDISKWSRNLQPRTSAQDDRYKNGDNDPRGPWISDQLTARNSYSRGLYSVTSPTGNVIEGPPKGRYWAVSPENFVELDVDNRIWWGKDGMNMPRLKRFLSEVQEGVVPQTIWLQGEVGNTQEAKKEILQYAANTDEVFQTPKPEKLLGRILEIATARNDLILDSFAGSGTTGAVAQKMGRRWIMVELGGHCHTHIIPRMKKVIDGEDEGGITKAVNWKGGGGFRYYHLAPSLLEEDSFGNLIISKQYNATMLTEAMCKLMGFTYAPSETVYWQQGRSTESDFIYVTTQTLTREYLAALSEQVGKKHTLLVCCAAFRGKVSSFPNLTLKKIPQAVLHKCEWGHDDYSLNIANLPQAPEPAPVLVVGETSLEPKLARKRRTRPDDMPSLFSGNAQGGAE